jgi:hypothetical protein
MATAGCIWDKRIDNAQRRFKLLNDFNDEAVLDRETGLVWERQPSNQTFAWSNARLLCAQKAVGGRGGWRLPAFNELASLVDPTVTNPAMPRLPAGHPFQNVQPGMYWTATLFAEEPGFAMAVNFSFVAGSDAPIGVNDANINGGPKYVWAVRGGAPGSNHY